MRVDDITFIQENRYLAAESCMETQYTVVRGAETFSQAGLHWVYTVRELRTLLDGAGLAVRGLYRSLDGEPFVVGSAYLVVVAEKTAHQG